MNILDLTTRFHKLSLGYPLRVWIAHYITPLNGNHIVSAFTIKINSSRMYPINVYLGNNIHIGFFYFEIRIRTNYEKYMQMTYVSYSGKSKRFYNFELTKCSLSIRDLYRIIMKCL